MGKFIETLFGNMVKASSYIFDMDLPKELILNKRIC